MKISRLSKLHKDYRYGFRWIVKFKSHDVCYKHFKYAFKDYIECYYPFLRLNKYDMKNMLDKIALIICICIFAFCLYMFENSVEIYDGYRYGFYSVMSLIAATMFINWNGNDNNMGKS